MTYMYINKIIGYCRKINLMFIIVYEYIIISDAIPNILFFSLRNVYCFTTINK